MKKITIMLLSVIFSVQAQENLKEKDGFQEQGNINQNIQTANPSIDPLITNPINTIIETEVDLNAISQMKTLFDSKIKSLDLPKETTDQYIKYIQEAIITQHPDFSSQYIFCVDSSFKKQTGIFGFWNAVTKSFQPIGYTLVSTGSTKKEHFISPLGFFQNMTSNPSYRAAGTYNSKGIRGFGAKGMRVWDFGWHPATAGWNKKRVTDIRFLMHATDPIHLEPRMGKPDSKGCIRIPAALNQFLDHNSILDALYEVDSAKRWVLAKDRVIPKYEGSWIFVFNSNNF